MLTLFFIDDGRQFKNLCNQFRVLNACFNYFWLLFLSLYEINNELDETGIRLRHTCSLNLRRSTVCNVWHTIFTFATIAQQNLGRTYRFKFYVIVELL